MHLSFHILLHVTSNPPRFFYTIQYIVKFEVLWYRPGVSELLGCGYVPIKINKDGGRRFVCHSLPTNGIN